MIFMVYENGEWLECCKTPWQSVQKRFEATPMSLIERDDADTVGDDGYRRIRTDIVFGRLRPGQKLKLEGLREIYGVSVSTLREILSRLTADGFVIAEGKRGFDVAPVSIENLKELAELRLLLESHAMEAIIRECRHGMGRTCRVRASQACLDRRSDGSQGSVSPSNGSATTANSTRR